MSGALNWKHPNEFMLVFSKHIKHRERRRLFSLIVKACNAHIRGFIKCVADFKVLDSFSLDLKSNGSLRNDANDWAGMQVQWNFLIWA